MCAPTADALQFPDGAADSWTSGRKYPREEAITDGVSASSGATAAANIMATMQTFALKQANQAQVAEAAVMLQALGQSPSTGSSAPHLGNKIDASA